MEVSANSLAEKKYRNIQPWLVQSVGAGKEERTSRTPWSSNLISKKQIKKNINPPVAFKSIPSVCFLPKSQHIVTSEFASPNSPTCRVQILDKKGQLLHWFPTSVYPRGSSSFGVASATENDSDIALCTGEGISLWTTEGKLRSHLKHTDVQNCCHITRMENGLLATTCITDMRGRCITLWDPKTGKIASQFGSRPEVIDPNPLKSTQRVFFRTSDIRLPWFLTSNRRNEIFIADRNAKCIKVFDTRTKKYLKHFDACGVNTRARKSLLPQGICIDDSDNIFVADTFSNSVLAFDRHGEFVKTLATESEHVTGEPWAVAMTTEPQFTSAICRSRCKGQDNAQTLVVSMAMPKPVLNIYKLSFCPHYTDYI